MQVVVEYRRTRKIRPTDTHERAPRPRVISAQKHQDHGRNERDTVQKAKALVHRHVLVERAMEFANRRMQQFPFDGQSESRMFWRSVYEYLRKHEERIRRAPMEFSWPAASGRRRIV